MTRAQLGLLFASLFFCGSISATTISLDGYWAGNGTLACSSSAADTASCVASYPAPGRASVNANAVLTGSGISYELTGKLAVSQGYFFAGYNGYPADPRLNLNVTLDLPSDSGNWDITVIQYEQSDQDYGASSGMTIDDGTGHWHVASGSPYSIDSFTINHTPGDPIALHLSEMSSLWQQGSFDNISFDVLLKDPLPAPEPSLIAPAALMLIALLFLSARRKRQSSAVASK